MKLFSILLACLAVVVGAHAQPLTRGPLTTNSALQRALTGSGAIYVSAAYGSDSNPSPGPFATLTYAQSVATSGQTIEVLDGTFAETGLGKAGVAWNLRKGVLLNGGAASVFVLTNGLSEIVVSGNGSATNTLVSVVDVTNAVFMASLYDYKKGSMTTYSSGLSNQVTISLQGQSGEVGSFPLVSHGAAGTNVHFVTIISPSRLTASLASVGTSNTIVTIAVGEFYQGVNGTLNVNPTVVFDGGRFSRAGRTASGVGANIWFKGVSCTSSNTDASAAIFTTVHGTFYFENERTIINNP